MTTIKNNWEIKSLFQAKGRTETEKLADKADTICGFYIGSVI